MNDAVLVSWAKPSDRVGVAISYAAATVDLRICHGQEGPASVARLQLEAALHLALELDNAIRQAAALGNHVAADAAEALDRVCGHA